MKTPIILGIVGVIVLAVVAAMFLIPSSSTEVLAPTPEPDENLEGTPNTLNQFVQEVPSSTPVVSDSPAATPATGQSVGATVEITDTGFTPATLTVKLGTTVTFVNHGQAQHWIASDPHPVHTLLPGFDSKKALATGDVYTFTFDKVGTWTYHDHFSPSTKGSIVVQ